MDENHGGDGHGDQMLGFEKEEREKIKSSR
jgi:hypothetical protein